ncbi:hypothetical protein Scep_029618 [Stephania cephalantha]|uniref:Uncharacterized protein n=1 Tax=Stephania cephalantha TaxID=152367 RepID=A0AAP0E2J0_9MAGN
MRRLPPWHLRLRIREALRHPAESRPPHHQGARRHRPSPIRHREDLYITLTVCQMVDTSSRVCCLAISFFFSFLSIKVAFFQFVQCCLLRFLCVKFWGFWILCVLYFPLFVWFDFVEFEMFVVNVQAFDAFIGADFLGRFTRIWMRYDSLL